LKLKLNPKKYKTMAGTTKATTIIERIGSPLPNTLPTFLSLAPTLDSAVLQPKIFFLRDRGMPSKYVPFQMATEPCPTYHFTCQCREDSSMLKKPSMSHNEPDESPSKRRKIRGAYSESSVEVDEKVMDKHIADEG